MLFAVNYVVYHSFLTRSPPGCVMWPATTFTNYLNTYIYIYINTYTHT